MAIEKLMVDVPTAADLIGVGKSIAWELVRDKQIVTVKIGARTLVPVKELQAYVDRLIKEQSNVSSTTTEPA